MAPYDAVITFPSSFHALRSEQVTQAASCPCKLIPSPRELSSSCAVSLALASGAIERIVSVLTRHGIRYEGAYIYERCNELVHIRTCRGKRVRPAGGPASLDLTP